MLFRRFSSLVLLAAAFVAVPGRAQVPGPAPSHLDQADPAPGAYIDAYRRLEQDPADLESRRVAAQLALRMASPALALDHASFALARLPEGPATIPFLKLAALAHGSMGEFAAAWNSLVRAQAADPSEAEDLEAWKLELVARYYALGAKEELGARGHGDLEQLGTAAWAQLWRASVVDPGAVERELDRRLAGLQDLASFREGFALRCTLWLARSEAASGQPDEIRELLRISPWLGREVAGAADLQLLALAISTALDRWVEGAASNDGRTAADFENPPKVPLAEMLAALGSTTERLGAAASEVDAADRSLRDAMASSNATGARMLEALLEARRCATLGGELKGELFGHVPALEQLTGGEYVQAEAAYNKAYEGLEQQVAPMTERLQKALKLVPAHCLSVQREQRTKRVGEKLFQAAMSTGEPPSHALAWTDELAIWAGDDAMSAAAWELRVSALAATDPGSASHGLLHAYASLDLGEEIPPTQRWVMRQKRSEGLRATAEQAFLAQDFDVALTQLDAAIQLCPMDERLLALRSRWLEDVAGPAVAAQALIPWWLAASPLSEIPTEQMELLYRAGEWRALLSLSEAALKDWPLSSTGFRLHSWAGAALDLPGAEDRVDEYLRRSERGPSYTLQKGLRDLLGVDRTPSKDDREWENASIHGTLTPTDLDAAVVGRALRRHASGKKAWLFSAAQNALKNSPPDPLRDGFMGGASPAALLRLGQDNGAPERAAFLAAAAATAAGSQAEAARLWRQCADSSSLAPLLRTHAARLLVAGAATPLAPLRQRDAAYPNGDQGDDFKVAYGRQVISHGQVTVTHCGNGALRFLGVDRKGRASIAFPGDATPLAIIESASASSSKGVHDTSCAWIARSASLGESGNVVGPLDAASCEISGRFLVGTRDGVPVAQANFRDVALTGAGSLQLCRPTQISGLYADAERSEVRLLEGGTLSVAGGLIDARRRTASHPWLKSKPAQVLAMNATLLRRRGTDLGYAGQDLRAFDVLGTPGVAAGRAVDVATSHELREALEGAEDGDTLRLTTGEYELSQTTVVKASVTLKGRGGSAPELRIAPMAGGCIHVKGGACLTLEGLRVLSPRSYMGDPEFRQERFHVDGDGCLLINDTRIVISDRRTVTAAVADGGVLAMRDGTALCGLSALAGSHVALDRVFLQDAWIEGSGHLSVPRIFQTTEGPNRMTLQGASLRVAAGPHATLGARAGSGAALLARACCKLRWEAAEAAYDHDLPRASSAPARARLAGRLATQLHAAGRIAWVSKADMEARLFGRLKPLMDARIEETPRILGELPYYFPALPRLFRILEPPTRAYIAANGRVALRDLDRMGDYEYLSLATEYELAYPLEHPDRRRAMALLDTELNIESVAGAIAEQKAAEERAAAAKRRRIAQAKEARLAAIESMRQEALAQQSRANGWKASLTYKSPYPTNTYIAAPSSYSSSSYRSNQAFYSRLNQFSGGGRYIVNASGVTYR